MGEDRDVEKVAAALLSTEFTRSQRRQLLAAAPLIELLAQGL